MANEETTVPASAWPGNESLETESVFSKGGTGEIPLCSIGRSEDWKVLLPSTSDWVSFRQTKKMFEIFVGKVQSFKERFFLIRPKSEAALSTLLGVARDGSSFPFFPLCWKQDHFRLDSKDFFWTASSLKEEETDAY